MSSQQLIHTPREMFWLMLRSFALLLTSCSMAVAADQAVDHPLLNAFPDSVIVDYQVAEEVNHRLILGALQRTRGEVTPENFLKFRGRLTQIVYELPVNYDASEAYAFFSEQLNTRNYELLFECSGRACGSSNYWANDVFKRRILYGPERNQYYLAARTRTALEEDPHLSLYIITRANRQLYVYLEVIETEIATAPQALINESVLADQLKSTGNVILPTVEFQGEGDSLALADPESLGYVLRLFQQNVGLRVYVVGHVSRTGSSLEELVEESTERARLVQVFLVEQGVDAARMTPSGVGPLAPACPLTDCSNRLELVLISD